MAMISWAQFFEEQKKKSVARPGSGFSIVTPDNQPLRQRPKPKAPLSTLANTRNLMAKIQTDFDAGFNEQATKAFEGFQILRDTPGSAFYAPNVKPTNIAPLQLLQSVGVDVSQVDANWIQNNVGLMGGAKLSMDGSPTAPTKKSTPAEIAGYAYYKLAQDEPNTLKMENEWSGLRNELNYWAQRDDRNYSDEEIIAKIDWKKYPTLKALDEAKAIGKPMMLNRGTEYSEDALYGTIWAARNGNPEGTSMQHATNYALGEGEQYKADPLKIDRRNPQNNKYNPYLLGSTLDEETAFFGVSHFTPDWLAENTGAIRQSGDETANKMLDNVWNAEERTSKIEKELADISKSKFTVDAMAKSALAFGMTADEYLEDYFSSDYAEVGKVVQSLKRKSTVGTTRAIGFDYTALRDELEKTIGTKKLEKENPAAAADQRKQDVLAKDGDLTQPETVPPSSKGWDWVGETFGKGVTWLKNFGESTPIISNLGDNEDKPRYTRNIKLEGRPVITFIDDDGEEAQGTLYSATFQEDDGAWVNVPRIFDGKLHTEEEAWQHYVKTQEHLGKHNTLENAEDAAQSLSDQQGITYENQLKPGAKAPQSLGQWAGVSVSDAPRGRPLADQIKEVENKRTAALIELQTLTGDAYDKKQDEIDGIDAEFETLNTRMKAEKEMANQFIASAELEAKRSDWDAIKVPEGYEAKEYNVMALHWDAVKNTKSEKELNDRFMREGSDLRADYLNYAKHMKPEDYQKYRMLYDENKQKASEFLDFIKSDYLDETVRKAVDEETKAYADEHPWGAAAESVLINMFTAPVESVILYYDKLTGGKPVTRDDNRLYATRMSDKIRGTITEDMSTLGALGIGTLFSVADNLGGRFMFGPAALLTMGFRASASTMQSALDRGATSDQAYALGFVSMAAEIITEKAQFERFTDIIKTSKGATAKEILYNFLMGGLKNAVPEGAEEIASGLANMASDIMVMGDKSETFITYNAYLKDFEDQGFGPDEANQRAWVETAKSQGMQTALDFAGGALSGFFFNALGMIASTAHSKANWEGAATTSTTLETETDADNRQTQAVQLTAQALGTKLDEETTRKYEAQVTQELGIGPVDGLAQAVGVKGGFFDVLDALMNKVKKPARVIQAYLKNGGDPVVTAKVNALLQAFGAEDAKVDAMVGEALLKDVQTKAETDLNYANKRWGQKGLLYINNLVESGREGIGDAVRMLQAMPSYAQSVVVAETNMQRLNVSQSDINAQMAAFAADLNMPEIAMNTAQRLEAQTVESRAQEIYTGIDPNKAAKLQTAQDTARQLEEDSEVAQQMQTEASDEAAAIIEQANTNPTAEATKEAAKAMDRLAQAEEQAEHIRVQQERAQQEVQKAQQELEQQQAEDMEAARALAQEEYEQAKLTRAQDMANTGGPDEARANETPVKKPRNQYAELKGKLQNAEIALYNLGGKLYRQQQGISEWKEGSQRDPVTADTLAKATQEYNDAATEYQNAEKLFNEFKGDKNNAELVSLYDDYDKKEEELRDLTSKFRATEFSEGRRVYGERARAMESAQRSSDYAKKRIDDYLAKNQIKADEPANTRQQDMANTGSPDEARLAEINVEEQADLLVNENLPEGTTEEKETLRSKYIAALNRKLGRYKQVAFSEKAQDFISKVAQKYQVTIEADEAVQGAEEAYYDPKTNSIHLNPNATQDDALIGIAMHELTHAAEVSEWYGDYSKAVLSIMYGDTADNANFDRAVQAKIDRYARDGKTLSYDDAVKEIVAQGTRQVIFDEASINKLVQTDVKLARKLLDALNRVINELKSVFMGSENAELEKARDLFEKALVSRIDRAPVQNYQSAAKLGKTDTIYNDKEAFKVRYAAIPASELVSSFDAAYPAELQPRDIGRVDSMARRQKLVKDMVPARLGTSAEVSTGSPILRPDNIVVAGNHRVWAIRDVLQTGKQTALDYTKYMQEHAADFGLEAKDFTPGVMLVRYIEDDIDWENFAARSNDPVAGAYSETENAVKDAGKLTQGLLTNASIGADLDTAANNELITQFINQVIPASERGAYIDGEGQISQRGFIRLRNALFQRAYNDANMTSKLSEQTDDVVKNVVKAMTNIAARIAKVNDGVADGALYDSQVAQEIVKGYKKLQQVRDNGLSVELYLNQVNMFEEDDATTKLLLRTFDKYKRSAKALTEAFSAILDVVEESGDPRQQSLPGVETKEVDETRLIADGLERYETEREGLLSEQYSLSDRLQSGEPDDDVVKYSLVSDKETIAFLEDQEKVTVYRAMQLIDDNLYPPMAARVLSDDGKKSLVSASEIGAWEQAEERPELIRKGGKFELDKANGSAIQARYNPYFHTSKSPLNDQFSSAYKRDNLVVVEGVIPSSELISGYQAESAKDPVGEMNWHSGPVSSKLRGEKARSVFLSRWFKPTRIVSDTEAASKIAGLLEGENIEIPYNVVTPQLAEELTKQGVRVIGVDTGKQYSLSDIAPEHLELNKNISEVADMQPVKQLTGTEFEKGAVDLREQAIEYFNSFGNTAYSPAIGQVELTMSGIRSAIAHNINRTKAIAFGAIKEVIENGLIIDTQADWKGRGVDRAVLAAPIDIAGAPYYVGAVVKLAENSNSYYLHDVVVAKRTSSPLKTGVAPEGTASGKGNPSIRSLLQQIPDVKQYSLSDQDIDAQIDSLLSRYGAIPQGENPTNLDRIPKKTDDGKKVRQFARNISESGVIPPENSATFKQELVDGRFSYEPISDQKAIDYAERLAARPDGLQQEWTQAQSEKGTPGKMQVAVGERLLMDYAKAGDVDNTMKMAAELAEVMTRAGQTVQAARLLKKMTNAGQLYYLQKSVNRINRNNSNANVELNPALVDDLLKAKTDQERGKAVEALSKDAGQQLPPSWKTRLNAWRYFAMLGNPRTHIRNLVGNAVFMPAIKIKNMIGAAIEKVTGSEKTKSIVINRTLLNAAMEDAKIHARELQSGGKYNPQNAIEQNRKSFGDSLGGRTLEAVTQANLDALEWEDGIFLRRHYANALAGYLQANKLTFESADEKTMAKARSYAVEEAKKATYRDNSELADWLSKMSKKGGIAGLVIEGVLPFKKTPLNILKRGIEYSPIGLLETIARGTKQLNKGTITQAQYIDKIAAGLTGTMIAGLGAFLSAIGAIKVGFKDDKEDEFRRLTGHQEYAIEIFGKSITLDWMVPSAMPLFVGATLNEMFEQGIDPENAFKETLGALSNIMEPAFNLTMLDGISRAVQSASWSENDPITEMLITSWTNFAGQFVPTLGGQIARTIDPVRRKSYTDKNSPLPNAIQRMIGTARNKIPGLAKSSEPYLDVWGKEERENSPWLRAFENFLSPAYINDLTPDAVETLLTEVYKQTGDGSVLPGSASKYFSVNGERIDLTGPQYTKYTKDRGLAMYGTMDELLGNTDFQALEPRLKAKALAGAIEYANGIGKLNISKDYKADTWIKEAKKSGTPGASIIERIKEAEREDARAGYRMETISAMTTGDEDSLEAMYGALSEWYREKDPTATPKQITSSVTNYLSNAVKTEYLAAYEADDDEQMELIENTLASLGIRYKYRDWIKTW